jgi:hypothetical protein
MSLNRKKQIGRITQSHGEEGERRRGEKIRGRRGTVRNFK